VQLTFTQEGRTQTHRLTHQISTETGLSKSSLEHIIHCDIGLKCRTNANVRETPGCDWPDWRQLPCIHHAIYVAAERPVYYKIWGHNTAMSPLDKSAGGKWSDTVYDWHVGWSEHSVIDNASDQWHRRLHACIWVTWGHFKYLLWHNLVKSLVTVIN